MTYIKRFGLGIVVTLSTLQLTACGGGGGDGSNPPPLPGSNYTIGGNVTGLTGTGLVLQNNSSDNLTISSDGMFTFSTSLNSGDSYSVTVLAQPANPTQNCVVSNAIGSVSNSNITDVEITCTTTSSSYSIGGSVSGLQGAGLVLQNNGGDDLAVNSNGDFTFNTLLNDGSTYSVTVMTQPTSPDQTCSLLNANGTVNGSNINNIQLTCVDNGTGNTLAGRFLAGSPVSGVNYQTATQSGVTNANGEFNYQAGETVRFSIGNIQLGEAPAGSEVTPFTLMGITMPQTAVEIRSETNLAAGLVRTSELEKVSNLTVLLHTLDDDGDASNGIVIDAQLHTVAATSGVHFDHKRAKFSEDYALRVLMADARAAGLWGGSRAIRNRAYAMDDLYDALGVVPVIYATDVASNFDYLGDPTSTLTYTYDTRGHITRSETDQDLDGVPDNVSTYQYDNNGNEVHRALNNSTSANMFVYDANGYKIQEGFDNDSDGVMDILTREFTYDSFGNNTVDNYIASNLLTNNTYDAAGNLLVAYTEFNGSPNTQITYTYDANNLLTNRYQENFNPSVNDSSRDYVYNTNDQLIEENFDSNADGVYTSQFLYEYDSDGNRTVIEYNIFSSNTSDYRDTYTYNSLGGILRLEKDKQSDGSIDSITTYQYDTNGNFLLREVDIDADGTVDSYTSSLLDTNTNVLSTETNYGQNSTANFSTNYTYTAINRWSAINW